MMSVLTLNFIIFNNQSYEHWNSSPEETNQRNPAAQRVRVLQKTQNYPLPEHQTLPVLEESAGKARIQNMLHLSLEVLVVFFPEGVRMWT